MKSVNGITITIISTGLKDPVSPHIRRNAEIEINGRLESGDIVYSDSIVDFYDKKYHLDTSLNRSVLHIVDKDVFTYLRARTQACKPLPTVVDTIGA